MRPNYISRATPSLPLHLSISSPSPLFIHCTSVFQARTQAMYQPKQNDYYPSAPTPPSTGIPVGGPNTYYPAAAAFQMQSQAPVEWSTGLCNCTEDCGNCCMTFCCPCVTFGRIAEIVDRGSTSCGASGALYALLEWFTCCHCIYSCIYRSKMRGLYNLTESPCNDCLLHCCCELCALCQEYRELKNRGFDMKIGWHANMERQAMGGDGASTHPRWHDAVKSHENFVNGICGRELD